MLEIESYNVPTPEWINTVITGARGAFESYNKQDSVVEDNNINLGPNDSKLLKTLAGSKERSHGKFLRCIPVLVWVKAPLFWWKEMDKYQVGTTTLSESTMHCIQKHEFTKDVFSMSEVDRDWFESVDKVLSVLNNCRQRYLEAKEKNDQESMKKYWREMIEFLPSSFMQRRLVCLNYEVLHNIYLGRKGHRLYEWETFRQWIKSLPLSELITGEDNEEER